MSSNCFTVSQKFKPKYGVHVVPYGDPASSQTLLVRATNALVTLAPDDGLTGSYDPLRLLKKHLKSHYKDLDFYEQQLNRIKQICEANGNVACWIIQFEEGRYPPFQVRSNYSKYCYYCNYCNKCIIYYFILLQYLFYLLYLLVL